MQYIYAEKSFVVATTYQFSLYHIRVDKTNSCTFTWFHLCICQFSPKFICRPQKFSLLALFDFMQISYCLLALKILYLFFFCFSLFSARAERYSHEVEDSEDMDDPDESALFSSFSSCSPRFRKVYSRVERELEEEHMLQVIIYLILQVEYLLLYEICFCFSVKYENYFSADSRT